MDYFSEAWFKVNSRPRKYQAIGAGTMRSAVRSGELKVARIGAGRNYVLCDEYVDQWLRRRSTAKNSSPE